MTGEGSDLNSAAILSFRSAVLGWYKKNGRLLPWRQSSDPYRIWISEIMLQQTTVAAVIPYFQRFTQRFPDVASLAAADQADVLRLWEGLGYYSRARNLHKAAGMLMDEFDGQFPADLNQLLRLPGVGRYTAGAIASFAFHLPAPIVEANTARLYARLLALRHTVQSTAGQKALWTFAETVSRTKNSVGAYQAQDPTAADFNQAVMDIGSSVCRPVDPQCPQCPLNHCCQAFHKQLQAKIPVAKPRVTFTQLHEVSVAIHKNNRWLLRQCREGERWTGLWDFVRLSSDADEIRIPNVPDAASAKAVRRQKKRQNASRQSKLFDAVNETSALQMPAAWRQKIQALTGLQVSSPTFLNWIRHTITRYHIQLLCLQCSSTAGRVAAASGFQWFTVSQIDTLPLSTTARAVAEMLPRS